MKGSQGLKGVEGQIGLSQGVILLYAVLAAKIFIQNPGYLIEEAGPAAWQNALIMTATGLLLFLPLAWLGQRFPQENLARISHEVVGGVIGPVLTLGVSAWLLAMASLGVRALAETSISAILPTTPPSVLSIGALLCMIFASYRGLEPISRVAQVLIPVIVAGIFILLLLSLPRSDVSRLFPYLGHGLGRTVLSGLWGSGAVAEAIILPAVGYAFAKPQTLRHSGLAAIALFGISATAAVAVLVMVFGAPDAAEQAMPMFNLARLVYLGRFVQRTEAVLVMFWFFMALVRLCALFHAGVVLFTESLDLPWYRPLVYPLGILVMAVSLMPQDFVSVLRLERDWMRPMGFAVLAVPLLLLIVAAVRGKRGEKSEA